MSKRNQSKQAEKKRNSNFAMAVISLILAAALLVVDLHILINKPANIIGLLGTTALMMVWVYFFVRALFLEMQSNKQETDTYLEGIIKSEKAFFIMQRKLEKELQQIGEYSKVPSEEIITAQKAIAKVTINRSKENTDALMNSNDQVLDKLIVFEDMLTSLDNQIMEKQKILLDNTQRDIIMKQQEIVSNMREMELSIKNEVLKAVNSINAMQSKMPIYMQEPVMAPGYTSVQREPEPVQEKTAAVPDIQPEESIDFGMSEEMADEIGLGDSSADSMELPDMGIGEPDFGLGEETAIEDTGIGESDFGVEGETAIEDTEIGEPDFGVEEEAVLEDTGIGKSDFGIMEESPIEDLAIGEPDFKIEEEAAIEDTEIGEPDFGIEEEQAIEDTKVEEPEIEIMEEQKTEPVPEKKPAMPDLSDPNKLMTPEEIAALIANMQ